MREGKNCCSQIECPYVRVSVANPKSGPDYSMIIPFFFKFYMTRKYFRIPPKMSSLISGGRVPQVENHWARTILFLCHTSVAVTLLILVRHLRHFS
jgi:hypothetical protein